jgi:hypothetical protein
MSSYVTMPNLEACGISPEDLRRLDPPPVEHVALDGGPCWSADDPALVPLLRYLEGDVP